MQTLFAFLRLLPFLFLFISASAQERYKPDSLLTALDKAKGSERVELLRHLSRAYIGADKEKSIHYAQESVAEAEKLGNDTFIVRSLNNLASAYQNTGDQRNSLPYLDRAAGIARKNGNKVQLLESLEFKATAYAGMRQMDKALPFAQEGLAIAEELKDSVGILNGLEIIAAGYKELGQLDEAVKCFQKEIALLEFLPKRLFEKGRVSVNLGEVYAMQERHKEAIALFEKGRRYFLDFGYPVGALIATLNLAVGYLEDGQPEKAGQAYREIIEMNRAIQEPELEALAQTGLGIIEMEKRNFAPALAYYQKAEAAAKPAGLHSVLKNLYGNMNDLYCLQGDYATAKTYKKLAQNHADSLQTADVQDRVSEYQVQYETAQKEKEIAEQQLKITEQQSEIFRKNTLNYGLIAGLLALVVLGWLLYNRFRLRQRAELSAAIIREQKLGLGAVIEAQEAERKRIAKDLHDGIAQELVALKLGFNLLEIKLKKAVPAEAERLGDLSGQLDTACTEVRNIAHVMMPPTLEQHGLAPSLELLLRNVAQPAGLKVEFDSRDLPPGLDEKTQVGLYRIAQELLNNIIKHARASKVLIQLLYDDNQLIMRIEDDGEGFDFDTIRQKGTMGVLNILSRVNTLGGEFFSEKATPHGTVSVIRVPV